MDVRLVIRWDGEVPGLKEHTLSLAAWSTVLAELLRAYRRVASGILTDAGGPDYGSQGGRLHRDAAGLDLQLREIREGCVELEFRATTTNAQLDFDLAGRVMSRFVESVAQESQGQQAHGAVRKLLQALPRGVTAQRWQAWQGDKLLQNATFNELQLEEASVLDLPRLVQCSGSLVEIGFEKPYIVISGPARQKFHATNDQVETAIALRSAPVTATGVRTGRSTRLLRLHAVSVQPSRLRPDERLRFIQTNWSKTMALLGQ